MECGCLSVCLSACMSVCLCLVTHQLTNTSSRTSLMQRRDAEVEKLLDRNFMLEEVVKHLIRKQEADACLNNIACLNQVITRTPHSKSACLWACVLSTPNFAELVAARRWWEGQQCSMCCDNG